MIFQRELLKHGNNELSRLDRAANVGEKRQINFTLLKAMVDRRLRDSETQFNTVNDRITMNP